MDKYKANLFDENFRVNWRKFLFDEENFEKDLIYNDNAKQIMNKTHLVEDYYKNKTLEKETDNRIKEKDIEKKIKIEKETESNDSKIDATIDQSDTTNEYFRSENSRKSKFLEN